MSTKTSKNQPGEFIMPETFSFGLEERAEETPESVETVLETESQSPAECSHKWARLPDEQQTLSDEDKVIWVCSLCNVLTNTYSWSSPGESAK